MAQSFKLGKAYSYGPRSFTDNVFREPLDTAMVIRADTARCRLSALVAARLALRESFSASVLFLRARSPRDVAFSA